MYLACHCLMEDHSLVDPDEDGVLVEIISNTKGIFPGHSFV